MQLSSICLPMHVLVPVALLGAREDVGDTLEIMVSTRLRLLSLTARAQMSAWRTELR